MAERPGHAELVQQADAAVASISDPELRRIAFGKLLDQGCAPPRSFLDSAGKLIQVLSVVVGVIVSVLSFSSALHTEARARENEARARTLEMTRYYEQMREEEEKRQAAAARPFLELRQKLYLEAVRTAGVLANPADHSAAELKQARSRFRELYVSELSLVEGAGVEDGMIALATAADPALLTLTDVQKAAYKLSHALRDSLVKSWGMRPAVVDNPPR